MLADLTTLVGDMVRDDASRIAPDQRGRAISLAVVQYGRDRPRTIVLDVVSPDDGLVELPAGATALATIEYPIGRRPPEYLTSIDWQRYATPAGPRILVTRSIAPGGEMRMTFTAFHLVTDSEDTVPAEDHEAVASYAAAILFDQMAATTSADGNPTIPADAVDHQAKPENFSKRAERFRQRYHDLLGIDVKRVKAASVTVEQPLSATDGGPRLTHRRGRSWR